MNYVVRTHMIQGIGITIADHFSSMTSDVVAHELNQDSYNFNQMTFSEKDNVIDIGSHVGMVSILPCQKISLYKYLCL